MTIFDYNNAFKPDGSKGLMAKTKTLKEIVIEGEGTLKPDRVDGRMWLEYHGFSEEAAAAAAKLGYRVDDTVKYKVIIERKG